MDIDSVIQNCIKKAKLNEEIADMLVNDDPMKRASCMVNAEEQRQIAEWLENYKRISEERPIGKWKQFSPQVVTCSVCGKNIPDNTTFIPMNFCTICGADNRGKRE